MKCECIPSVYILSQFMLRINPPFPVGMQRNAARPNCRNWIRRSRSGRNAVRRNNIQKKASCFRRRAAPSETGLRTVRGAARRGVSDRYSRAHIISRSSTVSQQQHSSTLQRRRRHHRARAASQHDTSANVTSGTCDEHTPASYRTHYCS